MSDLNLSLQFLTTAPRERSYPVEAGRESFLGWGGGEMDLGGCQETELRDPEDEIMEHNPVCQKFQTLL